MFNLEAVIGVLDHQHLRPDALERRQILGIVMLIVRANDDQRNRSRSAARVFGAGGLKIG